MIVHFSRKILKHSGLRERTSIYAKTTSNAIKMDELEHWLDIIICHKHDIFLH